MLFPDKLNLKHFENSEKRKYLSGNNYTPINPIQLVSLISAAIFHALTHNFANQAEQIHPFNPCHRSTQRKY